MKDQIIKFWRDEEGATAIEYGLIAGLIAVGLIVSLREFVMQSVIFLRESPMF